jgi:MSHA pilin protein MshA
MKRQAGFTLIELVAVLVILGLLGAMAVPRFANLQDDALTAAKNGSSSAVKSAHAIAIAKLRTLPQVDELVNYVGADTPVTAVASGIQVTLGTNNYVVPTYTDSTCTPANATTALTDLVGCVGSIP